MSITAIRRELRALGDSGQAAVLARFFKTGPGEYGEGDRFLGIKVPAMRRVAQKYRDVAGDDDLGLLLRSPWHEERLLALLILVEHYQRGDENRRRCVYDFYLANRQFVNNWDLVDLSAHQIAGAHLETRSRRPLYALARSRSLWDRRIAIVATFHFIARRDFSDTLAIAGRLLGDREDLLHKAAGWMLREVGKRDAAVLESFLRRHGRAMPRTMLRYAIERFPEAKRKAYLSGAACDCAPGRAPR